jgi:hypothetical protein
VLEDACETFLVQYIYVHKVSSGGSLVATIFCNPAVRGSNPAISQPIVDCQSSDRLSSGVVLHCRESSRRQQRKLNTKKASGPHKKQEKSFS